MGSKFCQVVNVNVIINNISICHEDGEGKKVFLFFHPKLCPVQRRMWNIK